MKNIMASLFLLFSLSANGVVQHVPEFSHWLEASRDVGVEPSLLYSMSLAESGKTIDGHFIPHPYAIAVGKDLSIGQTHHEGYYPETYDQAKVILKNLLAAGYINIGVGIMQINIRENSHLFDDPTDLLDPSYNISIAKKVIDQCSNNKSVTQMLSCYSHGRYDSEKGRKYAERVFTYENQYGQTYVKRHQPIGVLSLSELTYYYQLHTSGPVSNQQNSQSIEILTGTTTYEF